MKNDGLTPAKVAAPLGTVKDFLSDLRSDISNIKNFEEFKMCKPYLLGCIRNIELMLGLKEEE